MGRPRKIKQTTQENILQNEPQPLLSLSGLNDQILNEKPDEKLQASIVLSRSRLSESQSQQSPTRDINNTRSFNAGSLLNSPLSNNSLTKKQLHIGQIQQQLLNNKKFQYKKLNQIQNKLDIQIIKQKLDTYIPNVENKLSLPEEKSWKQIFSLNKNGYLQPSTQESLKNVLFVDYNPQIKNIQQTENIEFQTQHLTNLNNINVIINSKMLYIQLIILKNTLLFLPNPTLVEQNKNLIIKMILTWQELLFFCSFKFSKNVGPIKQINQFQDFLLQNILKDIKMNESDLKFNIKITDFENNIKQFIKVADKFIQQSSVNQSYEQQRYYCAKCFSLL